MNDGVQNSAAGIDVPSEQTIERRLLEYYDHAEQPGTGEWARLAPSLAQIHASQATQDTLDPQAAPADRSSAAGRTQPGAGLLRWLGAPQKAGRGGIIAAGLLVAVLLAGGTYAAAPLLGRVLLRDPGAQQATSTNLGRSVNIVRSAGGYTMTVLWVYADANRAIVGYRIAGPTGHTFKEFDFGPPDPTLTDANGRSLPAYGEVSPDLWPGSVQELIFFDAAAITDRPSELRLHLVVPRITVTEDTHGVPYNRFVANGPWLFDYAVPFHAGRTLEPHQAVTNNGHTITLDRAVLTPSETRLYFRGMPAEVGDHWTVRVSISVAGSGTQWLGPSAGQGGLGWEYWTTTDGQWVWSTPTPLISKHGRWTVTLTFQPERRAGESPPKPVVTDPLTFRFDVP